MPPTPERSFDKPLTPSPATTEGAQLFHPMGAAGLLAEGRNLPVRNDDQLLAGMPSNQTMMKQMGFQMQQLGDRLKVDFPAEQNALTTGKHLASEIRDDHRGNTAAMRADFQNHDVRGIFVHGHREGKENAFYELDRYKNLQSTLNELAGGKGQPINDAQSASKVIADAAPDKSSQAQPKELAGKPGIGDAARVATLLGDMTNKQGTHASEQFDRILKMMDKGLSNPADKNLKHQSDNKSVDLTRNQYDAINATNRDSSEQHIFNSYIANLTGSQIERMTHGEQQSEHLRNRLDTSLPHRVDQKADDKQIHNTNDKAQQGEHAAVARNHEAELAAQRNAIGEKENTAKTEQRNEKQSREDAEGKTANSHNSSERQTADRTAVVDPTAHKESSDASDSVSQALSDLSGLLTQLGESTREKLNLHPIMKLKMLMKMRVQIMQKFRLMWKAKNKLMEKLKLKKKEKAKAKLYQRANRQKQNNQRLGDAVRSGHQRRRDQTRREREAQREERQRSEVKNQDRTRLEARRSDTRQPESKVNLDGARALRQSSLTRSDVTPQHHLTQVACIGRPTHGLKQSLFGPVSCGSSEGAANIQ